MRGKEPEPEIRHRRLPPGKKYIAPAMIDEMVYRQFLANVALSDWSREEILRALVTLYLDGGLDRKIAKLVEEERGKE